MKTKRKSASAQVTGPQPLTPGAFTRAVQATLSPLADPTRRTGMQAYMKNKFVYLGIQTPTRRAALAPLIKAQKSASAPNLLRSARLLWALPEREYQYVAVDLLARHVRSLTPRHIPALLALVRKKSWWDTVDALASIVNRIVRAEPQVQLLMDEALAHNDFWVRRVAILHQLAWRDRTDSDRLFRYAVACAHEKEFFIRKAIGWALRDYARHAPGQVRTFLRKHKTQLSPLTVREAGKHIL